MDLVIVLGSLHGGIMTMLAVVILYSDHKGFRYFTGREQTLSPAFVQMSHKLVWTGLILMIITGVLLTMPSWEYWLTVPAFYIKLGFVLVLLVNSFAIGKLSEKSSKVPFAELSSEEKRTLKVSGALSATGWIFSVIIGIFFL